MEENISPMKRHYELSLWFSSQLDESQVEPELNKVLKEIEKLEGTVTFNQLPQLKQLAYPIKKERNGYFGYLKFDCASDKVEMLKKKLDLFQHVLRYLLVKIPDAKKEMKVRDSRRRISFKKTPAPTGEKTEISQENISIKELDKRLNEILKN